MKTRMAQSTAWFALIASLMGTAAHAGNTVDAAPTADDGEEQSTAVSDFAPRIEVGDVTSFDLGLTQEAAVYQAPLAATAGALPLAEVEVGNAIIATDPLVGLSTSEASKGGVVTLQGVDAFYGDINPFYGTINPFYGDIDAFWGTINPFYGDINPFWGTINPFYGTINPFYGDIDAFWGDIDAFYGDIVAFDQANLAALGDFWQGHYAKIAEVETKFNEIQYDAAGAIVRDGAPSRMVTAMNELIAEGEAQFGAAYTTKTGQSFDSLVNEIFARHGTAPGDRASLELLDARQRAALYLDWHDTLNQYSGIDAIDHWMASINWTPAITQIQGDGAETIIGIIDSSFSGDADLGNNIIFSTGHTSELGGHGAGVASLIAGAHDGEGVMGIAPNANIATHNPFAADGTASWDDILQGIKSIQYNIWNGYNDYGWATIMNLSLGESGYALSQGLADTLANPEISWIYRDTIFVVAAGNDGITQTTDVNWNYNQDMQFILVGSVNPAGEISSFSNRPGSACLLDNGVCNAGNELYMRTIVAPGEMILVSDGQGGLVRRSGTSFAAPLVSGAIALMHDRWPWLTLHPNETAEIVFRSAQDLGAPGPDEVYGWGLLDVAAMQSPLDFNAMEFKLYKEVAGVQMPEVMSAASLLSTGLPGWWETDNVYFTGIENIGDTYRDFAIPASAFQRGKSTNALGRNERMQDFIQQRFSKWIQSGGQDSNGNGKNGGSNFSEARSNVSDLSGDWTLRYDAMAPRFTPQGEVEMVHGAATLTDPSGKASFTLGHGEGAMALSGYRFGIQSDHDPFTGGVNPVLGLASGDAFMQVGYQVLPNTKVAVGFSQNREHWYEFNEADPQELLLRQSLGDRPADAFTLDIEQRISDSVSIGANFTRLNEDNALLGTQTANQDFLGSGSETEAVTLSASFDVGAGISFDFSATGARTETDRDQLFTSAGSVWSTAAQFTATKQGIFGINDTLRVSIAQPLQVEDGQIQFVSDEVVNRDTGEIAQVTRLIGIETERRITGEAVYATPLTNSSELGVFSRYSSAGDTADEAGFVVGGNFSLRF